MVPRVFFLSPRPGVLSDPAVACPCLVTACPCPFWSICVPRDLFLQILQKFLKTSLSSSFVPSSIPQPHCSHSPQMLEEEAGRWYDPSGRLTRIPCSFCHGLPDVLTFHFAPRFNLRILICVKWKVVLNQFSAVLQVFPDSSVVGHLRSSWMMNVLDVSWNSDF